MLREINLAEVSDGKLYTSRDMVKAGCDDCRGCCDCCKEMGKSVVLDPMMYSAWKQDWARVFRSF